MVRRTKPAGPPLRVPPDVALALLERIQRYRIEERAEAVRREPHATQDTRHTRADAMALARLIGALQEHLPEPLAEASEGAAQSIEAEP